MMNAQHLKKINLGQKMLCIVDNHQYVLPLWGALALKRNAAFQLVSIDYHPDTNPSFWLNAYQKAMAIDPSREEALVNLFQKRILDQIDPKNLESLAVQMPLMRNDEHINTAMEFGYLSDYHMINCMEKHCYSKGHHYLVEPLNFGKLTDRSLSQSGFDLELIRKKGGYLPFILDIDLDYFMKPSDFEVIPEEMMIFKTLVQKSSMITCARSVTYFNHLKRDTFDIESCEKKLIQLLETIISDS
ncbi:MAG: hypothetical protein RSE20_08790 [Eubacterium sp.]